MRLLERHSRGVRLTEAGAVLLRHAERALAHLEAARAELATLAERLAVGAFGSAWGDVVPRAAARFRAEHPDVALTLHELEPREGVAAVRGRRAPARGDLRAQRRRPGAAGRASRVEPLARRRARGGDAGRRARRRPECELAHARRRGVGPPYRRVRRSGPRGLPGRGLRAADRVGERRLHRGARVRRDRRGGGAACPGSRSPRRAATSPSGRSPARRRCGGSPWPGPPRPATRPPPTRWSGCCATCSPRRDRGPRPPTTTRAASRSGSSSTARPSSPARRSPSAASARSPTPRRRRACGGCSATSRAGTPTCTAASSSPPDDDGADLGVLFWHKDGFSTACGHGTIALGAWAVETGRVAAPRRRRDVDVDVPSGRVGARVRCARRGRGVAFRNVPAYVIARGAATASGAQRRRRVRRRHLRLAAAARSARSSPSNLPRADRALGREIKWALDDPSSPATPTDPRLSGVYGTILHEELGPLPPAQRHRVRRRRGRPLAVRLGHLARGSRCSRARRPARRSCHESIVGSTFRAAWSRRRADGVITEVAGTRLPHRRAHLRARPARRARHGVRAAVRFVDAAEIAAALPPAAAVDALEAALRGGLDPEPDPPRTAVETGGGQLLLMPSRRGRQARHRRRATGSRASRACTCCSTRRRSRPPRSSTASALTDVRTSAVSALAARHLRAGRAPAASSTARARRRARTSTACRPRSRSSTSRSPAAATTRTSSAPT